MIGLSVPDDVFMAIKDNTTTMDTWNAVKDLFQNRSPLIGADLRKKCQGLAGPWYARCERETVKARIQWFNDSMVQMRARAQARQKTSGKQWIARDRRRQD